MSKLHREESLESLLPNSVEIRKNRTDRYPHKAWSLLTFINSLILIATFVIVATSFQTLQSIAGNVASVAQPDESLTSSTQSRLQQSESSIWPFKCGNTTDQAIKNGCIFDIMLASWLHPECYRREHYSKAYQDANATFFLDKKMTIPFPEADTGNWPQLYIYTNSSWHNAHCTYIWERQITAWTSGSKIDSRSWSLPHSKHCMKAVLDRRDSSRLVTKLRQSFSDCGRP